MLPTQNVGTDFHLYNVICLHGTRDKIFEGYLNEFKYKLQMRWECSYCLSNLELICCCI